MHNHSCRWRFYMSRTIVVVLLIALVCVIRVDAAIISSSQLQQCIRDGSVPEDDELQCSEKIVVTLTVDPDDSGTQELEATIQVTEDDEGTEYELEYPIRLVLSKGKTHSSYPLTYKQSFNSQPFELTGVVGVLQCDDGDHSGSPTCGWYRDENGDKIADSQGFCCHCSLSDMVGFTDERTRVGMSCDPPWWEVSSFHCLNFGLLWYDGYSIGPPSVHFDIDVKVLRYDENQDVYVAETIGVSPSVRIGKSQDEDLIIRLLGDFSSYQSPLELSGKYLMVPARPLSHDRVLEGQSAWMFIDKNLVTLNGNECDKIGVSFPAFQHQPDGCRQRLSSCLRYQLDYYHNEDTAARAAARVGEYFIDFYGNFKVADSSSTIQLMREEQNAASSVITVTLNADSINYVVHRSSGRIVDATISDFEAQSRDGILHVQIENTGRIVAQYYVSVTDCSPGIRPILGQSSSIEGHEEKEFVFSIQSQYEMTRENSCRVRLWDSLGEQLDFMFVNFTTTAVVVDEGEQGPGSNDEPDNYRYGSGNGDSGDCSDCFKYDVFCMFEHRCVGDTMESLLFLLFIIFLIILILKLGIISKLFRLCCGGSNKKEEKSKGRESKRSDEDERAARKQRRRKRRRMRRELRQDAKELSKDHKRRKRSVKKRMLKEEEVIYDEKEKSESYEDGDFVFFNIENGSEMGTSYFFEPGEQFSIAGRIFSAHDEDNDIEWIFEIPLSLRNQRKYFDGDEYVRMSKPRQIGDEIATTELTKEYSEMLLSKEEIFPCINMYS